MINRRCVFQDRAYTRTIDLYNIYLCLVDWLVSVELLRAVFYLLSEPHLRCVCSISNH